VSGSRRSAPPDQGVWPRRCRVGGPFGLVEVEGWCFVRWWWFTVGEGGVGLGEGFSSGVVPDRGDRRGPSPLLG